MNVKIITRRGKDKGEFFVIQVTLGMQVFTLRKNTIADAMTSAKRATATLGLDSYKMPNGVTVSI